MKLEVLQGCSVQDILRDLGAVGSTIEVTETDFGATRCRSTRFEMDDIR
jgi:hypothetical protein